MIHNAFKFFRRKSQLILKKNPSLILFFGFTCLSTYVISQAKPIVEISNIKELEKYKNFKNIQIIDNEYAMIQTEDDRVLRMQIPNYEYFEKNVDTEPLLDFGKVLTGEEFSVIYFRLVF